MATSGKGPRGVGDGPERASGVGRTDAAPEVERADGVSEVAGVEATRAAEVQGVRRVDATGGAAGADAVGEVAAALRAGRITVSEAVDRLIDDAVNRRVGRAIEPGSELEARLRRVLKDFAGADPLISEKIRRLESRRGPRRGSPRGDR